MGDEIKSPYIHSRAKILYCRNTTYENKHTNCCPKTAGEHRWSKKVPTANMIGVLLFLSTDCAVKYWQTALNNNVERKGTEPSWPIRPHVTICPADRMQRTCLFSESKLKMMQNFECRPFRISMKNTGGAILGVRGAVLGGLVIYSG